MDRAERLQTVTEDLFLVLDRHECTGGHGMAALATALCMAALELDVSLETLLMGIEHTHQLVLLADIEPQGEA